MRTASRLTAITAVLIAALGCAGAAFAKTVTQSASAPLTGGGTVSAQLSYTPTSFYDSQIELTITRAGQRLFSGAVTGSLCGRECSVGGINGAKSLHVVDLQHDGEPDVFVDLYSGGAHCCTLTEFYTYDPGTQTYRHYEQDWADPGYLLKRLDGSYVFDTDDDRFAYAFTDFAASGEPLELLSFNGLKMINVTRRYPALIAKDAANWLTAYKDQGRGPDKWSDSVGVIAAWAADEDELGHSAMVARYLTAQAGAGHLRSSLRGEAGGEKFVRKLDALLKRYGYLS